MTDFTELFLNYVTSRTPWCSNIKHIRPILFLHCLALPDRPIRRGPETLNREDISQDSGANGDDLLGRRFTIHPSLTSEHLPVLKTSAGRGRVEAWVWRQDGLLLTPIYCLVI